jgi:hypothetical protein
MDAVVEHVFWEQNTRRGVNNMRTCHSVIRTLYILFEQASLVVKWSEFLTTDHEVPGSIPGSTMGIFP